MRVDGGPGFALCKGMKLIFLLFFSVCVYAQEPTTTESNGKLTKLSGTPDIIEVEDLKSDSVAIEANGAGFLISLFSKTGALDEESKRKTK